MSDHADELAVRFQVGNRMDLQKCVNLSEVQGVS